MLEAMCLALGDVYRLEICYRNVERAYLSRVADTSQSIMKGESVEVCVRTHYALAFADPVPFAYLNRVHHE